MAASDWVEIYQSYPTEKLKAEVTSLQEEATPYSGQQMGSKSYQKDLREVRDRLQAATRVLNARKGENADAFSGVADFSQVNV